MLSLRFLTLFTAWIALSGAAIASELSPLPQRDGPRPQTTDGVPHVQIGVAARPELSEALLQRIAAFPGIDIRPTIVSLPGALGFWVAENTPITRPGVIVRGREFAHLHPDGSLHATLSPERAREAVEKGWAIPHPWAGSRPGWGGFVMIYTPISAAEMEVVNQLIMDGFTYVTEDDPEASLRPILDFRTLSRS